MSANRLATVNAGSRVVIDRQAASRHDYNVFLATTQAQRQSSYVIHLCAMNSSCLEPA
jgi:hypothetical protein